jgi:hypothetical protein
MAGENRPSHAREVSRAGTDGKELQFWYGATVCIDETK